jgi:hypothetical protein
MSAVLHHHIEIPEIDSDQQTTSVMLARSSGLGRLKRLPHLKPAVRCNSSHHHPDPHHPPIQGDGNVRNYLQLL